MAELAPGGVTLWQDDFVSRGGHALVDAQRRIGARNRLGLRVYYDRAERTQSYIQPTYDTLDAQTQHTYDGDRHGVVWGAGFRWWQDHSSAQRWAPPINLPTRTAPTALFCRMK
ncbi:MAG: hypothetical protein IPH01_10835 [Elusimicrobia bacterium]|nr:hypothetical protein [Elusimicrobiota bacterium]